MMKLYDYILSADCYKVRLLCALLGVKFEPIKINVYPGRDHLKPDFTLINPRQTIPVLGDGERWIRDTNAILIHLAKRYDSTGQWLPRENDAFDEVMEWLGFSARELDLLQRLRTNSITSAGDASAADLELAHSYLTIVDDHLAETELSGRQWLVGTLPTIADIAVFVPAVLANDGGVTLDRYPALWRWFDRVKRLDHFIVMPGIFPNLSGVV
jgi:glutathione S-transferase